MPATNSSTLKDQFINFNTYASSQPEIALDDNQLELLRARYFLADEDWRKVVARVSWSLAQGSAEYKDRDVAEEAKEFFNAIHNMELMPSTPFLMNAGTKKQNLFACYVLDINDDLESIYDVLGISARIFAQAGGCGYNFGNLRPDGTTTGIRNTSSGVLSFMGLYDASCAAIKAGSSGRRGAMLAALPVDHPEILDFIKCKENSKELNNFNISVLLTDEFMAAVRLGGEYKLKQFKNYNGPKTLSAPKVFKALVRAAWKNGEPGVIFLDTANRYNPVPSYGRIVSTNPCGEVVGINNSVCCLAHVNFAKFITNKKVDYAGIERTIRTGIRFLDNAIDVNRYIDKRFELTAKGTRQIGLGFMGFADQLTKLGIRYGAPECIQHIEELGKFFQDVSHDESEKIAKSRGVYPKFEGKTPLRRNSVTNTVAPTGSVGMLANASYGIEPHFALSYVKNCAEGRKFYYDNKDLLDQLKAHPKDRADKILEEVRNTGALPDDLFKKNPEFITANQIPHKERVRVQAAWQKYIDLSISSTINLPETATKEEISAIYMSAWEKGLKGITIYRNNSRSAQVLNVKDVKNSWTCDGCGKIHVMDEGVDPEKICIKCECGYKSCA